MSTEIAVFKSRSLLEEVEFALSVPLLKECFCSLLASQLRVFSGANDGVTATKMRQATVSFRRPGEEPRKAGLPDRVISAGHRRSSPQHYSAAPAP